MTFKAEILARFSGEASGAPLYLPDLTLWYNWHHKIGSLPAPWQHYSLPQIARAMGVPIWLSAAPWRIETPGIEIVTTENEQERLIAAETSTGTLVWRWQVGPDGAWWQTEYPVKTAENLPAALELVQARTYVVDPGELAELRTEVGTNGLLAIEIPRRPYSILLHEFLGWSEGLLLLNEPVIEEINSILETKTQTVVQEIAKLPGELILSPDNLDGQFISPGVFEAYLTASYRRTAEVCHAHNKVLLVHVGGPIRHLLALLAGAGVDGLEGIAGLPQSNATLTQAREITGPHLTLWGGIPQDFLLETHPYHDFEASVVQATQEIGGDGRMILGVADRVPVDADLSRLEAIPELVAKAWSGRVKS
jgi:hypothetical protein